MAVLCAQVDTDCDIIQLLSHCRSDEILNNGIRKLDLGRYRVADKMTMPVGVWVIRVVVNKGSQFTNLAESRV